MIISADYHTHTPYSHGKGTVMENAARAKEIGLEQIGITDHGFSHLFFGVDRKKVGDLKRDCAEAQKKLGIDVFVGIEANILGEDGKTDLLESDYKDFELFIAGKHVSVAYDSTAAFFGYFLGNFFTDKLRLKPSASLIKRNTLAYINTIKKNPVDIISHLNYLCPSDAVEVAKCAADYGTLIELNSKKTHLTDDELSDIIAKTKAYFVVDSDAHTVDRVGDTKLVDEQLARVGMPDGRILNDKDSVPIFRFSKFKREHGYG